MPQSNCQIRAASWEQTTADLRRSHRFRLGLGAKMKGNKWGATSFSPTVGLFHGKPKGDGSWLFRLWKLNICNLLQHNCTNGMWQPKAHYIKLIDSAVLSSKAKHIDVKYHHTFTMSKQKEGSNSASTSRRKKISQTCWPNLIFVGRTKHTTHWEKSPIACQKSRGRETQRIS